MGGLNMKPFTSKKWLVFCLGFFLVIGQGSLIWAQPEEEPEEQAPPTRPNPMDKTASQFRPNPMNKNTLEDRTGVSVKGGAPVNSNPFGKSPSSQGSQLVPKAGQTGYGYPSALPASPAVAPKQILDPRSTHPNSKTVILSKAHLSNWNQTRTNFIGLTGQIKASPQKSKLISNAIRKLNEIDRLMQRVDKLQKNPQQNRLALKQASVELRKHEKQIKGILKELGSPRRQWNKGPDDIGDDSQLANIDLQTMLQKQQQLIQMLSNVSKVHHYTASAVVRKIG